MYEILLLSIAQRDLEKLDPPVFRRVLEEIRTLSANPRPNGSLKLTDEEGFRIRVGKIRILFRIDDQSKKVFIYRVKNRDKAYGE